MKRISRPFLLAASSAVLALPAAATITSLPGLRNTGVDAAGTPLPTGASDPHFAYVGVPPSGSVPIVLDHNAFPVGPWLDIAAGPNSRWIVPNPGGTGAAGTYTYRTTFNIPAGVDPTQVFVRGRFSGDDPNAALVLNGQPAGFTNAGGFTAWSDFTLQRGFSTGPNTLDFVVTDAGGCCTGLRVEFSDARGGAPGQVPIPGLTNSGVATAEGTPLGNGSAAPGLWSSILTAGPGTNPVYAGGAGVVPSPPWLAPDGYSSWLTLAPNDSNAPEGTAYVTIPFDLTGLDPATAHIFGRWSVDNNGGDVYLNGVPTGNAQVGSFTTWSDFSISVAEGDVFLPGMNYLTFQVENLAPTPNPAGIRWEILSATAAIPEPSVSLLALGTGALFLRRRRA